MQKPAFVVAFLLAFLFSVSPVFAEKTVKIGVVRLLAHPDHLAMYQGFQQGLAARGYEIEEISVFNADSPQFPKTYPQRGAEAASKMVAQGAELIFSTAMYHAIKNAVGNTPVVDAAFLSPLVLKNAVPKNGQLFCTGKATGTYLTYPFVEIGQFIRESFADLSRVAYIYHPKSPVSRPVSDVKKAFEPYGLTVVPFSFTTKAAALAAIQSAAAETKVGFITNDVAVSGAQAEAVALSQELRYPLIFGIIPAVKDGAAAAFQLNWHRAGQMCAEKAVQILSGTPASTMPIEKSDDFEFSLNIKTIQAMGVETIPYAWLELATEVVE